MIPEAPRRADEKVFVKELSQYLHHSAVVILAFARKKGFLRHQRAGGNKLFWVTPYGAARIIAYVRAIQGDTYLQGKDFHRLRERWAQEARRAKERKRMKEMKP